MRSTSGGAELALVEKDQRDEPRRKALVERVDRLQLGEMTEEEVRKILTIDPATWDKIQEGVYVRPSSYTKAHKGIDAYVEEHGLQHLDSPGPGAPASTAIFEFTAAIDDERARVRFTAKGRPEDADLIREQVTKAVLEAMRRAEDE